ncbi:hypothetical protein [Streptomyces sp. NTK 937]|uniref:hypothetical protein n=1 Tax=Streptomyces sp. NTK 937 TaxID=1487711 RepID=UPI0012FF2FD1|nr:hypothetical protein [Streptomyces sp. NTK 937]
MPPTPLRRCAVAGEHDTFLPPRRLGPAVREAFGIDLDVVPRGGHLLVDEAPAYVAALIDHAGGTRASPEAT